MFVYLIFLLPLLVVSLFVFFAFRQNSKFIARCQGNGIIFGRKGGGKSLSMNFLARRVSPLSNVPISKCATVVSPVKYFDMGMNTSDTFANGIVYPMEFIKEWESVPYYLDDVNAYFPNWLDNKLKKLYPGFPLFLTLQRQLYDSYTLVSMQDNERPWKIIRELNRDFAIKVEYTRSFWFFWFRTYYVYYEKVDSVNISPYKKRKLRRGDAEIELEAQYGLIAKGYITQRKSKIDYDTRYFKSVFFSEVTK